MSDISRQQVAQKQRENEGSGLTPQQPVLDLIAPLTALQDKFTSENAVIREDPFKIESTTTTSGGQNGLLPQDQVQESNAPAVSALIPGCYLTINGIIDSCDVLGIDHGPA